MTLFCSNCGRSLIGDDNFCPQCGKPTSSSIPGSATPSNTPTIPAFSFKNTFKMPSTDYGSNPYGATSPNSYEVTPLVPPPPPPSHRNKRLGILIGIGFLILILGNIGAWALLIRGTQNNASMALSTGSSISNGTLLYEADWSNGLNGWTGTPDWTVLNGMLHNDGTDSSGNSPTIVAPYQVESTTNYAVEIRMQVVAGIICFDISTIRASGSGNIWQGYKATVCGSDVTINAGSITGTSFDRLAQVRFDVGHTWHTYRLEAKDIRLNLFIDGKLVLGVDDSRYSSGGKLGFKSEVTQLNVSSFKVFAL